MNPVLAYLMVLVGVFGHASSEFFAVLSGVSGPQASVWRFVLGAAGLIVIALAMPQSRNLLAPFRQDGFKLVWLSLGGVSAPYLAFHWALDFASVVQVGTLVTTIPIFVGLTNLVVNKMPITAPKILTAAAAIIGIALLVTDGLLARLAGTDTSLIGIALAIGCAAGVSAYAVLARPLILTHGAITITTVSTAIGAIGLWLAVGLFWGAWVNPLALLAMDAGAAWPLLTMGLWNTTATQLFWLMGLAAVPDITRGSYLFFLKPAITAALALLILKQPISAIQAAAIVVICGAVAIEMMWPWLAARRSGAG